MTQATLNAITTHYQQQIAAHDLATHRTLATAHAEAVRQLQPHLDRLYREIEQKQQTGEDITLAWLYREKRLQTIKQTVEHHIDAFSLFAHMLDTQAQREGVTLGSHSGHAQVRGLAQHGQLINTPSYDALNALSEHQDSARSHLFQGYGAEAAQEVTRSLLTGVSLKQPIKQVAASVLGKLKHSLNRAVVTVGETFMGAYRAVVSLFYRANSNLTQQWMWQSSAGCCPICADLNGSIHSIDEDFNPPHPHCRCEAVAVPISETEGDTQ